MSTETKPEAMTAERMEKVRNLAGALLVDVNSWTHGEDCPRQYECDETEPGEECGYHGDGGCPECDCGLANLIDLSEKVAGDGVPALLSALEEARRKIDEHKDFIQSLLGAAFGEERRGAGWETEASAVEDMRALAARVAALEGRTATKTRRKAVMHASGIDYPEVPEAGSDAVCDATDVAREQIAAALVDVSCLECLRRIALAREGLRRERDALTARVADLEGQCNAAAAERDALREKRAELDGQLEDEKAEHVDTRGALELARVRVAELEGALATARAKLEEEIAGYDHIEIVHTALVGLRDAFGAAPPEKAPGGPGILDLIAVQGAADRAMAAAYAGQPVAPEKAPAPEPKGLCPVCGVGLADHEFGPCVDPAPDEAPAADPLCARDLGGGTKCGHPLTRHAPGPHGDSDCWHIEDGEGVCPCPGFVPEPSAAESDAVDAERTRMYRRAGIVDPPAPSGVGDGQDVRDVPGLDGDRVPSVDRTAGRSVDHALLLLGRRERRQGMITGYYVLRVTCDTPGCTSTAEFLNDDGGCARRMAKEYGWRLESERTICPKCGSTTEGGETT